MKYDVTAVCLNPETGEVIAPERMEVVDTAKNELFVGCKTLLQVAEQYMLFWNRPNRLMGVGDQAKENAREMVLVTKISKSGAVKEPPNPATFSVPPTPGQKRVSARDHKGKHMYWNVHPDVVAVKGTVRFVAERNEFYGGEASREYESAVFRDPTWADVFDAFRRSIPVTRDYHHCFLEGVYPVKLKGKQLVQGGAKIYHFSTGS